MTQSFGASTRRRAPLDYRSGCAPASPPPVREKRARSDSAGGRVFALA